MNLVEAPSTNIFLTYATMSIPIDMYPIFFLKFVAFKEIEKYNNSPICKKRCNPKTSSRTTIDVDDIHFDI